MTSVWHGNLYEITSSAGQDVSVPSVDDIAAGMKPKHQQKFREAIENLPPSMALVPVVYTKIPTDANRRTMTEFMELVEPAFYQRLAEDYGPGLRAAGFCDHAIEAMKKGHAPTDAEGRLYNYDVDHVIERGGGGLISLVSGTDPQLAGLFDEPRETLTINHMDNFYFLPREVHELKNTINLCQLQDIKEGESRLIYMAVPAPGVSAPFFVPDGKYGPRVDALDPETCLEQSSYVALAASAHAASLLERFEGTPEGFMLRGLCDSLQDTPDTPEAQRFLREQVDGILGDDDKARFRYAQICEAFAHACQCWEATGPRAEGHKRQTLKPVVKNFNEGCAALSRFGHFILQDGARAQSQFDDMRVRVHDQLDPSAPLPAGGDPRGPHYQVQKHPVPRQPEGSV